MADGTPNQSPYSSQETAISSLELVEGCVHFQWEIDDYIDYFPYLPIYSVYFPYLYIFASVVVFLKWVHDIQTGPCPSES